MRHVSRLNDKGKDGSTVRAHLEERVRRGLAKAEELEGPACPEEVQYLVDWAWALYGRSGVAEGTILPLSYPTLDAFSRLEDVRLEPYEVGALLALDGAIRNPEEPEAEPEPVEMPKWPERKPGVEPVFMVEPDA